VSATKFPPASGRILLVDDDEMMRLLARTALEGAGFVVDEAQDGEAGLEIFRASEPDLVLLDVMMPGLDGFETCEALRLEPHGADVPVLMMTGLDDVDSIRRAYRAGATDFVTKPLNYVILQQRIRYMIRAGTMMEALRKSERRLRDAQRIARLGHWEVDLRSGELELSEEAMRIYDVNTWSVSLEDLLALVHDDDRPRVRAAFSNLLVAGSATIEHRITLATGDVRHVVQAAQYDGTRVMATIQDFTERRATEGRLAQLAYYDAPTGLPNRAALEKLLGKALDQPARADRVVALFSIEIDGFKRVVETLGHAAGDAVLREVGQRLLPATRGRPGTERESAPPMSQDLVARIGSDDVAVLLTDVDQAEIGTFASRFVVALAAPMRVEGVEVFLSASVGIAIYPESAMDADSLLRDAGAAREAARARGGNGFAFYNDCAGERDRERLVLVGDLHRSIERGELELYYQPKVDANTRALVGVEALMRWRHKERGLISPAQFIPVAEETGFIVKMGAWALQRACVDAKRWIAAGLTGVSVAVNISPRQFLEPGLLEAINSALADTGLPPTLLEVELTESTLVEGTRVVEALLSDLRKRGVKVSLDDFGTGYSSLSYLSRLSVDTLKIDRAFVKDLPGDRGAAAITLAILAMSQSLGLTVVAEGVEEEAQADFLRDQGCDLIQGYYFSKPLAFDDLVRWARARTGKTAPRAAVQQAR
jgi:diguanylate cyclase (GGDEF)-like protein